MADNHIDTDRLLKDERHMELAAHVALEIAAKALGPFEARLKFEKEMAKYEHEQVNDR